MNPTPKQQSMHCDLMTWGEVMRLALRVAAAIRRDGFRPDVVVAIARGGYIPARLLCDLLDLYDLSSLRITHYQGGAKMAREARLSSPLSVDVRDRDVLLVDDVSDSGDTLRLALEHVRGFGPRSVKVAVLHHKQVSPVTPDYYGKKIVAWRWLIYPWAVMEDLTGFLLSMDPCPESPESAVEKFRQVHGLRISPRLAAAALDRIRHSRSAGHDADAAGALSGAVDGRRTRRNAVAP